MRARVDAALTLDAREVPPKVVERLCRMLSSPNPAFLDRLRLGLNPGTELDKPRDAPYYPVRFHRIRASTLV